MIQQSYPLHRAAWWNKYSLKVINNQSEFVKSHAQEANDSHEKIYLLQRETRQLSIINTMALAILLLVFILYVKTLLNR